MHKTPLSLAAASLLACNPVIAQVRVEQPPSAPTPTLIAPSASFDAASAKQALDRGTAVIEGRACAYHDNLQFDAANRTIHLLPVTPYLEQWLELRERGSRHPVVPLPEEVLAVRMDSRTDEKGRFRFSEMKPGRYYLVMAFGFNQAKSRDVYAGSGYGYGGSAQYFRRENYQVSRDNLLEKTVEIRRDGQVVKTAVRNKGFWNKGGLFGKLLPCTW